MRVARTLTSIYLFIFCAASPVFSKSVMNINKRSAHKPTAQRLKLMNNIFEQLRASFVQREMDKRSAQLSEIRQFSSCHREDGHQIIRCPSRYNGRHVCVHEDQLCDNQSNCPKNEDEDLKFCMFRKGAINTFETSIDDLKVRLKEESINQKKIMQQLTSLERDVFELTKFLRK